MGRWEPNARGRLARATLVLSAEKGYENTTVAEIAASAGVTERTFYRYFADKADAFFPDNTELLARLRSVVRDALAAGQAPPDAALAAVGDLAVLMGEEPERILLGARVIPTVPVLAGRSLLRHRQIADVVSEALRAGGVPALESHLAAEAALAIWQFALSEWGRDPQAHTLPEVLASTTEAARQTGVATTGPAASSGAAGYRRADQ